MRDLQIMAPAGGGEQLVAAVRCGANAVYLGAKGFNARRNAANFGEIDLKNAVSYCHERGCKVFVTVNTLVFDSELIELEREADNIAASGADAVIIQDMATLRLFINKYPTGINPVGLLSVSYFKIFRLMNAHLYLFDAVILHMLHSIMQEFIVIAVPGFGDFFHFVQQIAGKNIIVGNIVFLCVQQLFVQIIHRNFAQDFVSNFINFKN